MAASFTHTIDDSTSAHLGRGKQVAEYIHPCQRFSGGVSEGNSSLFIELLLACLRAERRKLWYVRVWREGVSPHQKCSVKPAPWAIRQEHNAEVAYSAELQ